MQLLCFCMQPPGSNAARPDALPRRARPPPAGVTLNTHPPTHTPNMFSWFPIFFPLREPMPLPAGADVVAHMWRRVGKHKVWYEWAVSAPAASAIHNPGGRSYWVGL